MNDVLLAFLTSILIWSPLLAPIASARWTPQVAAQFAQWSDEDRRWLRNQLSPATHINCCSEADGSTVEEDIRCEELDGAPRCHYRIRFDLTNGEWREVPDEIVIHDPNRHGAPVVWWYWQYAPDGTQQRVLFRCYAPGGGV